MFFRVQYKARPPFQHDITFYTLTDLKPAVFLHILTGLFIGFGLSTKSPLTFFSVPISIGTGAAGTDQAQALTLIAFLKLRDSGGIYSFLSIAFKVLMVSSFLLGMLLFCPSERVHPGGLQEK